MEKHRWLITDQLAELPSLLAQITRGGSAQRQHSLLPVKTQRRCDFRHAFVVSDRQEDDDKTAYSFQRMGTGRRIQVESHAGCRPSRSDRMGEE